MTRSMPSTLLLLLVMVASTPAVDQFVGEPLLPHELGVEKSRWAFPCEKGDGLLVYTVIDRNGKRAAWMHGNALNHEATKAVTILVYDLGFLLGENDGSKLYVLPGVSPQRVSDADTMFGGGGVGFSARKGMEPEMVGGDALYRLYSWRWHGDTAQAPDTFAVQVIAKRVKIEELKTLFKMENEGFYANRPLDVLPPVIQQVVGPVLNAPQVAPPPKVGADNF